MHSPQVRIGADEIFSENLLKLDKTFQYIGDSYAPGTSGLLAESIFTQTQMQQHFVIIYFWVAATTNPTV